MSKEIREIPYHLYLGCEVMAPNPYEESEQAKGILTGIHGEYGPEVQFIIDGNAEESPEYPNYENTKLLLRKLSSMTEEDVAAWDDVIVNHTPYCVELDSKDEFGEFTEVYPDGSILSRSKDDGESRPINGGQLFALLLSKGFDLFNLIPEGLALDSDSKQ